MAAQDPVREEVFCTETRQVFIEVHCTAQDQKREKRVLYRIDVAAG